MLITIEGLLPETVLDSVRKRAAGLTWQDGQASAGAVARAVKRNEQADLSSRTGARLRQELLEAIRRHPVVSAAAWPKRFARPVLSRTSAGGGYGYHADNAVMAGDGGEDGERVRADLSFTLFLSPPDDYDGGELVIEAPGQTQALKPEAGGLVLYPSTALHQVAPVSAGERLAFVGWIESRIRGAERREILFDLANTRHSLKAALDPQSAESLTLSRIQANLVRLWADT